jgi:protease-4
MFRSACTVLMGLAALCSGPLVSAQAPADAAAAARPEKKRFSYAHIEVKGSLPEGPALPGLFGDVVEPLEGLLTRLKKAADDDKLHGVIVHINGPQAGWGKVHEIRQAIAHLRGKGKTVYGWLESGQTRDYLIACSCDKVVAPESAILMLPGLRAEVSFYKNLLDFLEVKAEMLRVGEYKSAAEPYSRTEMSPEFREEMEAVLDGFYRQSIAQIADSRKLPVEQVRAAIDLGVMTAAAAKERGLIDHVLYEDDIPRLIQGDHADATVRIARGYGKKQIDTDFSGFTGMVKMMNLLMGVEDQPRRSSAPKLAVISAVGPIMSGASSSDLFGEQTIGSATMIKAIRQARDDDTVKAVVLRVDSPGGSALASDLIWHELETVKKPVIASMGDVAASGGYYIAMGADRIFAEPGTITGSIGVVGGKLALEKFFAKIGITHSIVQKGKNAGVLSVTTPFTDDERQAMQGILNDIYRQFTSKAAAGRKMPVEQLEKLARGRIYTGEKAKELGLVDDVGTLDDAIAFARQAAGIDPATKLERLNLPKPAHPFEALFGPLDTETRIASPWSSLLLQLPESVREPLRHLSAIDLLAREPALTLMPFRLNVR